MKKSIHLVFALASTVVIILSSGSAKSQDKKEIRRTIIINNSDTIINGKKLRDASPAERKALLKELDQSQKAMKDRKVMRRDKDGREEEKEIIIREGGKDHKVLKWRKDDDDKEINIRFNDGPAGMFKFDTDSLVMAFGQDSLMKDFRFKIDGLDSNMRKRIITMNRSFDRIPGEMERIRPRVFMGDPEMMGRGAAGRNNSQTFNYVSTDKDGISSRMSIRISEANEEALKKLNAGGKDKGSLDVNDLNLSPNFSNGKLNLSFNMPEKGSADVKILDSNFKEVFTEKAAGLNGTYFKQVSLPKNGIYYIRISQGNKIFVRKMVKE